MAKHVLIRLPQGAVLYDPDLIPHIEAADFSPQRLAEQDRIEGVMDGRGQVYIVMMAGREMVLRHFHRGGLLARLRQDAYLWTGVSRNRAFREWHLLQRLQTRGLPVPRPAAARVVRTGVLYRADIITLRLPGVESLAQTLNQGPLDRRTWRQIGTTLRRFHRTGAYHADLNAMNILLDNAGSCFVIDWDKGRLVPPRRGWQQRNLKRLRRSLEKLRNHEPSLHFRETDWSALCDGYDAGGV